LKRFLLIPIRLSVILSLVITLLYVNSVGAIGLNKNVCLPGRAVLNSAACEDSGSPGNPLFGADGIITNGVQILSILVGIAAVVVLIISGIRMITSGGDANSVAASRQAIFYAIIGLVVAVLSQAIINYVVGQA